MAKLPAYQFYPADWRKDPGVQALSFHDRGVWFEILCLMHESEERGKLMLGGQPMPESALARLLGLDKQNLTNTLTTLLSFGVASRDPDTGALISRRMVRDEQLRKIRQNSGKMGGNPRLVNQNSNQKPTTQDKQNPTPSVSSSPSGKSITESREGEVGEYLPGDRLPSGKIVPTLETVKTWCQQCMIPEARAQEYLDSRNSCGWIVAGTWRIPGAADLRVFANGKDQRAADQKSKPYSGPRRGQLSTGDYNL